MGCLCLIRVHLLPTLLPRFSASGLIPRTFAARISGQTPFTPGNLTVPKGAAHDWKRGFKAADST
jgi:hypothetical protein